MKTISVLSLALLDSVASQRAGFSSIGTDLPPLSFGSRSPIPALKIRQPLDFDIDVVRDSPEEPNHPDPQPMSAQQEQEIKRKTQSAHLKNSDSVVQGSTIKMTPPGARKLPAVKQMISGMTDLTLGQVGKIIRSYGCFCYVGSKMPGLANGVKGNIEPLDDLDHACRDLTRAEKCLKTDSDNGNYGKRTCDMRNSYKWFVDDSTKQVTCGDVDPNKKDNACKLELCELEKSFSIKVKNLFASGFEIDQNFRRMSEDEYINKCLPPVKTVDYAEVMLDGDTRLNLPENLQEQEEDAEHSSPVKLKPVLACCGDGLRRRSYNTLIQDCCEDGKVRPFGMC